jgi:hypothetical protein
VLEKRKAARGGLFREPAMALLVLWFFVYLLIEVFRGVGTPKLEEEPAGAALAIVPDEDTPIRVDWELLPDVEQTSNRN